MNILISACLMGVKCRYNGIGMYLEELNELMDQYHLIPICPEIFGGMETPRDPAEILEGRVMTKTGEDVTMKFQMGANEVLELAKLYDCKLAILKERSPSCGAVKIYDGTFSSVLVEGNGILAELLINNGIRVIGETQVMELLS